ncbi:MAG: aminotransferase class V-fold PLP-dependent enzyme, partial [Defluviitaleaceae bacterium]|nr:aminotransferase class V-fold PLP-dependent enzyme [Defluviitaleaceae bacterium]
VSHETGDINDVEKIAADLKKINPAIKIHVDGAQGFCKENFSLENVDFYTFSGHKIHGAHVGGLFVRDGVRISPLIFGGSQEQNLRAGTENLRGIIRTAAAAKFLFYSREKNLLHVSNIKNEIAQLAKIIPDCEINSLGDCVSPYILNISFLGIKGETLVHFLSERGIFASMGAACRSRKKQKSMLELMGFDAERAESAVRFSFSHMNTQDEAAAACEIIAAAVKQIRRVVKR